ncbi:ABC transporter ATP-binding protein [Tissierella sp. P1]|uniref:ABC transporter ATP-binding protein n=1 Tax=Tissierella sp. P1 TaxID=1280483 RepID=UPI001F28433B|nr:ATP-binding cassette domain-containing protein [Tissierella sp. P1]
MSVITVSNLTKDYGKNRGIFDLSFEIHKGEVFGYLGPNGAGKTTTIRHLLGFLNADKGECHIGQLNCRTDAEQIQRDLGYLPGEIAFFDDMSGIGYLKFIANMRGMKNFEKMNELISYFELDPSGRIKKMSKGMKQKIGIVSAFMHDPSTLILDEPTSGLDPLMQNKFIELILNEKSKGKTILMSSHSFEEVERTCDRIGIIKKVDLSQSKR